MVKIIENYTLHEQIGEGEYGKVYRGVDSRSGREVAAKVINVRRFKDNPKLEECTLNEIEVLTKIDCPHIVKFIEILKTVNNFYFFYEYCNAGTLDQQIRKNGYLPQSRVLEFLQQLIEAFRILSANNIMHRDLKPSNIMLHNGRIKLGDFGFCKSLQNQRDLAQTMLGSPIYMAPQVLRGQIYTIKADIWSLGVVVYQMAFGFCPFQESSIARLINALQYQELQINREINPISSQLEQLLRQMLVKDHFKRISWEQLFQATIHLGKTSRGMNHHRALSEANRNIKKQPTSFQKQKTVSILEPQFLKKKPNLKQQPKDLSQQIHQNLKEILKVIDKAIRQNTNPEITCILTLRLYRVVLKTHSKLGNRKQFIKERMELNDAINAIVTLIQSEEKENQAFSILLKQKRCSSFLELLQSNEIQEVINGFNAKQLEKVLVEANLIKN